MRYHFQDQWHKSTKSKKSLNNNSGSHKALVCLGMAIVWISIFVLINIII